MDYIKISNGSGLELTVTSKRPEGCQVILGGDDEAPDWKGYIAGLKEEFRPHGLLIKDAIEKLGWTGKTGGEKANNTYFGFSDGIAWSFTWRAWGDLMSAIVNKNEGYMTYYM